MRRMPSAMKKGLRRTLWIGGVRSRCSAETSCKVMSEEYDDMSDLFEKRKKEIGETAELVSKTTSAYLHDDKLGG